MTRSEQTLVALNEVAADRADEFEEWLRTLVVPVMNDHRPHVRGLWRVLRATAPDDGVVVFAFVFEGGSPEDWALDPILVEALGAEGAERELATFTSMLTHEQRAWSFTTVPLDG